MASAYIIPKLENVVRVKEEQKFSSSTHKGKPDSKGKSVARGAGNLNL